LRHQAVDEATGMLAGCTEPPPCGPRRVRGQRLRLLLHREPAPFQWCEPGRCLCDRVVTFRRGLFVLAVVAEQVREWAAHAATSFLAASAASSASRVRVASNVATRSPGPGTLGHPGSRSGLWVWRPARLDRR